MSSGKPHRTGVGAPLLTAFDRWFASAAGVWQTFAVTVVIVILERVFPHVDPNGFWLLYVLTIYSGITQPALAHVGATANKMLHEVLAELRADSGEDLAVDQETNALVKRIAERLDITEAEPPKGSQS
ncbi:hypothetical protein ACFXG4_27230 [Nocardia sp. NPDC059246]|uniref:hypothetical protein n=1 Tax=unclassified Nocardia TaxID=2637762 RepID=UPI0036844BA7